MEEQEFSILDPEGMNTVAFAIENDILDDEEILTLKMLSKEVEQEAGKSKKTFFVELDPDDSRMILIVTIGKNKVVMNSGVLQNNEIEIVKKPDIIRYEPIINSGEENIYRDFKYTPNLKRPISLIDSETGEEVKPTLYLDENSGEVIGKIKMVPFKPYISIEVRNK